MKKIYALLLILILMTGCEAKNNVEPVIKESEERVCNGNYANNDEQIVNKLSNISDFKCDNLNKYLNYIDKYSSAPYDDVIYLVNNGIDADYSKYLMNLVKSKYFILNNLSYYLSNKKDSVEDTISYVNAGRYRSYYNDMIATDTSKDILMIVNKYYRLGESYTPSDLELIDANYSKGVNNKLRHTAKVAFEDMAAAAKLDNIIIYNLSAYRSYQSQVAIYNRSVANYGVTESDKTSARPGNSEHQTGLTLDVNSVDDSFKNTNAYKWLINNSYKYGYILRYPEGKEDITGYAYEPWHYRYVGKDVAKQIHDEDITFDEYYAYYLSSK
jgi:LAS superfamily LD-carboxypeptidase LdcB